MARSSRAIQFWVEQSARRAGRRRREAERLRRIVLEHDLELAVGEAARTHCFSEGADALEAGIFLGRGDLGPEFGDEAVFLADLADRVRPPLFERVPVVALDESAELRGLLHLLGRHLAGE